MIVRPMERAGRRRDLLRESAMPEGSFADRVAPMDLPKRQVDMKSQRFAFTLVELLVVLAIIGILISLLLPAVQSVREAARLVQCRNHLKQIALACLNYETSFRQMPGYAGEPPPWFMDLSENRKQNVALSGANWISQVLPFMEQQAVFDQISDLNVRQIDTPDDRIKSAIQSPISTFYCPTRRGGRDYPLHPFYQQQFGPSAARTDYGINGGAVEVASEDPRLVEKALDGIWIMGRLTEQQEIRDGTSQTYLVGEKAMDLNHYETGMDFGDRSPLSGYNATRTSSHSYVRYAARSPKQDSAGSCLACHDFGSAHFAGWNVAMADGSVQLLSYTQDLAVHRALSSINQGEVIDGSR